MGKYRVITPKRRNLRIYRRHEFVAGMYLCTPPEKMIPLESLFSIFKQFHSCLPTSLELLHSINLWQWRFLRDISILIIWYVVWSRVWLFCYTIHTEVLHFAVVPTFFRLCKLHNTATPRPFRIACAGAPWLNEDVWDYFPQQITKNVRTWHHLYIEYILICFDYMEEVTNV